MLSVKWVLEGFAEAHAPLPVAIGRCACDLHGLHFPSRVDHRVAGWGEAEPEQG